MINLDKYRIIQLDKYNLTFEEYKQVENPKDKTSSVKWVKAGGYYGNLEQCLKALKDYIISNTIKDKDDSIQSYIKYIDELNRSYINCILNPVEIKE